MQKPHEFDDLTAIPAERRRYFTPAWFRDLLAARLSLGDTFWIGNFGTALITVPAVMLFVLLARVFLDPGMAALVSGLAMMAIAVYYAVLALAVLRTALPRSEVGGWRWVGVACTLAIAVGTALLALVLLAGAGI
ncbi:MAG: hypothetical protein WAT09_03415 [Paracoccaceae bacterium]